MSRAAVDWLMPGVVNRRLRQIWRFASVFSRPMDSRRLPTVPVDSSHASRPLPGRTIAFAVATCGGLGCGALARPRLRRSSVRPGLDARGRAASDDPRPEAATRPRALLVASADQAPRNIHAQPRRSLPEPTLSSRARVPLPARGRVPLPARRPLGLSRRHPQRHRDPSPRNIHVAAAAESTRTDAIRRPLLSSTRALIPRDGAAAATGRPRTIRGGAASPTEGFAASRSSVRRAFRCGGVPASASRRPSPRRRRRDRATPDDPRRRRVPDLGATSLDVFARRLTSSSEYFSRLMDSGAARADRDVVGMPRGATSAAAGAASARARTSLGIFVLNLWWRSVAGCGGSPLRRVGVDAVVLLAAASVPTATPPRPGDPGRSAASPRPRPQRDIACCRPLDGRTRRALLLSPRH